MIDVLLHTIINCSDSMQIFTLSYFYKIERSKLMGIKNKEYFIIHEEEANQKIKCTDIKNSS